MSTPPSPLSPTHCVTRADDLGTLHLRLCAYFTSHEYLYLFSSDRRKCALLWLNESSGQQSQVVLNVLDHAPCEYILEFQFRHGDRLLFQKQLIALYNEFSVTPPGDVSLMSLTPPPLRSIDQCMHLHMPHPILCLIQHVMNAVQLNDPSAGTNSNTPAHSPLLQWIVAMIQSLDDSADVCLEAQAYRDLQRIGTYLFQTQQLDCCIAWLQLERKLAHSRDSAYRGLLASLTPDLSGLDEICKKGSSPNPQWDGTRTHEIMQHLQCVYLQEQCARRRHDYDDQVSSHASSCI